MKRAIIFVLGSTLLVYANLISGQTKSGSIAGRVFLSGQEPAIGATVLLVDTKMGASTGEDGTFVISDVPPGQYEIKVRLVGYEQGELEPVTVLPDKTARIQVTLRQVDIELNPVVVTGTRRQGAEDVRSSVTTILPRESKFLPGAAEDVLRSLQALPGVTSVSDFSSQLVVRGSGPDQNLIMIDGFEVLNPYRLYGFVSMFNPETVSDISLQTGGFAAEYGDRLSAVLDVRNREGRTDVPYSGKINTSLTNMNIIVEGGLPLDNASYLVSLRRTYYDLILGPVLRSAKLVKGDVALPNFRDVQAKIALPLDESNKLLFNAFMSRDGVQLVSGAERDRPDSVSIVDQSYNTTIGATWQFNPTKNIVAQTQLSWYRNKGSGYFDGTFVDPSQNTGDLGRNDTLGIRFVTFAVNYDYIYEKSSLAQRLLLNTGTHSVELGYGVDALRTDFIRYFDIDESFKEFMKTRGLIVPTNAVETISYNRYNVFVQDRVGVGDLLYVQPGVRLDVYPLLKQQLYVSPRLNVSYKIDDLTTMRAAYGLYYQSPGMEKQDFRNRLLFTRAAFGTLEAERADHYILGFDRMLSPEWQFKVETYYKSFSNVIVPEKLQGSKWYTPRTGASVFSRDGWLTPGLVSSDSLTSRPVNDATGNAYGVELMAQKIRSLPTDKFTGWVSYALSYADRDWDGIKTPFLFDQRHAMNIVGNYKFAERWDVGVKFTLRSGRPYSKALGVTPRVVVQRVNGMDVPVLQIDSRNRVIVDVDYEKDAYSGRLNLYHSLDVRLTTYPQWWGLSWSLYLDIQNVYNHENQQQLSYYIDDSGSVKERPIFGIPIFPSLGMSVAF